RRVPEFTAERAFTNINETVRRPTHKVTRGGEEIARALEFGQRTDEDDRRFARCGAWQRTEVVGVDALVVHRELPRVRSAFNRAVRQVAAHGEYPDTRRIGAQSRPAPCAISVAFAQTAVGGPR